MIYCDRFRWVQNELGSLSRALQEARPGENLGPGRALGLEFFICALLPHQSHQVTNPVSLRQVLWYINGHPVANDATHKMLINEAGNNALMITSASQRDSGTVTCVARNKSGEVSHQVRYSPILV